MFRPMWSSSGVKIFGEETAVVCCRLCREIVVYIGHLDAHMCLSWWVVFSLAVTFCCVSCWGTRHSSWTGYSVGQSR
jgi:hypothetical protein